jgi:hypothetical protein
MSPAMKMPATADDLHVSSATAAMAAEAALILSIARAMSDTETAERLFSRLEAFDNVVEKSPVDPNETFVALGLPTAHDFIHLTTTRKKLDAARQWVRNRWSGAPPTSESDTLASLMLIYVVNEGWMRRRADRAKRPIWDRIKHRVDAVL